MYIDTESKKKQDTKFLSISLPNINQFSFTSTLSRKFAIKWSSKIPPHFKSVATLPCEILVIENYHAFYAVVSRNPWLGSLSP